jgi:hypothetical protein
MTYAGTVALTGSTQSGYVGLSWADFAPDGAHWLVQPYMASYGTQNSTDTSLVVVDSQFLASPVPVSYPPFIHGGTAYPLHGRWAFYDSTGTRTIAVAQVDSSAAALLDFAVLVL